MGLISGPIIKHDLNGLGSVQATYSLGLLAAANPTFAAIFSSPLGKPIHFIVAKLFTYLASAGLVMMNIGAAKILTVVAKSEYDGSWDTASKLIDEIRLSGREMTPEEIAKIDEPVKEAFRKFAKLGSKKK